MLTNGSATPDTRSFLSTLLLMVLALAVTRLLLGVVSWAKGVLANRVGVALTFNLRGQLVQKLHALGVGYYDRHQVGSLVGRVAYDSEVLHKDGDNPLRCLTMFPVNEETVRMAEEGKLFGRGIFVGTKLGHEPVAYRRSIGKTHAGLHHGSDGIDDCRA